MFAPPLDGDVRLVRRDLRNPSFRHLLVHSPPLLLFAALTNARAVHAEAARLARRCVLPAALSDWLSTENLEGRAASKGAVGVARGRDPPDGELLMQPLLLTASRYTGCTWRKRRFFSITGAALAAGKSTNERPPVKFLKKKIQASLIPCPWQLKLATSK